MYVPYFVYPFIKGQLDCFHILTIANNATVYVGVQISVQVLAFNSFGCIPTKEIAMFNFLRNCHTIFLSSCTILHSYHQCIRIPVFPHPHQQLLFLFLIIALPMDEVVCHCGSDLHFPIMHFSMMLNPSVHVLIDHMYIFFLKIFIHVLPIF